MRAAILAEPGKMICETTNLRPPEDGEVVVKTTLAAICGSDLHVVFDGMGGPLIANQSCPHGFPGHEGLGEVVESRSSQFKVGSMVLTCPTGGYSACFAEYQVLPASYCIELPAYDGPFVDLLMAQQMGTTIFALRNMPCDFVGKNVMVMGQGSAGVFFSYMAKRMGAKKVIVSDLSESRLVDSHLTGADVKVQADKEGENVRATVEAHTDGQGVDFLIEAVGRQPSFLQSVDLMKEGGQMLWFGLPDTSTPIEFNFQQFFRKKLQARSIYGTQEEADLHSFKLALELIATRQIDVSSIVSHTVPIEEIQKGLELAHYRHDNAKKVAVSF